MIEVYLDNKKVFSGTAEEADTYCKDHEWDYTQDTSYAEFERACGIWN